MDNRFIVVDDPSGQYWEGALVDPRTAHQLRERGCEVLPIFADLARRSAVGGYFRRAWGSGWSLDTAAPKIVAPMMLYVDPVCTKLHWCARLVLDPVLAAQAERPSFDGSLRIAADVSQVHTHKAGVAPDHVVDNTTLGPLVDEGFTVRGTAKLRIPMEAHYGFALYGYMPGLRVAWAACSVAPE